MASQIGKITITINVLLDNSKSKDNQTKKIVNKIWSVNRI